VDYRFISSDDHLDLQYLPPDLWTARLPASLRARAPRVEDVGTDVEVLGRLDDEPVLVRQGRVLAASFHPELTDDTRVHEKFLEIVREAVHVRA